MIESAAFRRAVSGGCCKRGSEATINEPVSREQLPHIFSRHSALSLRKVSGLRAGIGLLQLAEEAALTSPAAPRRVVLASVGRYEKDGSVSKGRHMIVIDTGLPSSRTLGLPRAPLIVDGDEGRKTAIHPLNAAGIHASFFTGQVSWCREVVPKHVQGKTRPLPSLALDGARD